MQQIIAECLGPKVEACLDASPPYLFALAATTCFVLTILFVFKNDKIKSATLLGGLFFLCTILAYFPHLDSIAAFNINVKLRQNLDRAEEILKKFQEERSARIDTETAMLKELKWRGDIAPDVMHSFIEKLKASKADIGGLAIYTLIADPEANDFGNTVLYAMKEAGIDFKWGRIPYLMDIKIPVSLTGITIHDLRNGKTCHPIMEAFLTLGMSAGCFFNDPPIEIQLPALFVMLKQPAFFTFPKYLGAPNLPTPPWQPK
jgi:hypothetical protein